MIEHEQTTLEQCGENFKEELFQAARLKSKEVVQTLFKKLRPGLLEKEIVELIDQELFAQNAQRLWHPTKVRIEKNTVKSFPEKFDEIKTLEPGDLIFFDIGPVFEGHEGDYGETFIFHDSETRSIANHHEKKQLVRFSKELFKILKDEFHHQQLTGEALYKRAVELSAEVGLQFNLRMGGHRLGDFPHAIYSKAKLKDVEFVPMSGLWVLEIHLINPEVGLGAFFEDLI